MTAYTKVNGSDSSANSKVLNGLLKTELGFQGFVISDWYGQHTGVASAKAGLDVALPSSVYWNNHQLSTAAMNGTLETARLDDMVVRMLAAWYRYAKLETPGMALNVAVDARDPAAEDTIFQGAVEGHVLVKNINNALPLSKPRSLGIYGFDAANSAFTDKRSFKYPLSMLNTHTFPDGTPFADINCALLFTTIAKAGTVGPDVALNGTLITGGGSGGCSPDTTIAPYDAFLSQSKVDGTTLHTDFWSFNPVVDPTTDAAIVFVNEQASEAWDRVSLASPYADELIKSVAAQHHNTIVVIHNAGIRLVDRWYDNPNITAVIYGHLPGQASGSAITEIMYGRQSPSGRLPYTVGKSEADYGDLLSPTVATASNPYYAQSDFVEGLHIDYKAFIKAGITPRFPFGFGLTYTTFAYSSLHIARNAAANSSPFPPDAADSSATVAPEGGLDSLYDTLLTITATITNIGHLHAAAEVAQLYLGIPDSGVEKVLRGFDKVMIQPGETAEVQFPLRRRDVSVWDVAAQQWRIPAGTFRVYVGKDVLDEDMLTGSFELIAEDSPLRNAAGLQGEQVPL
jgi:beta-glucosidase